MKKTLTIALAVVFALLTWAVPALGFPGIRHGATRMIWGVIDGLGNISAARAKLPEGVETQADIPYVAVEGKRAKEYLLDAHYPKDGEGPLPVILYIHGNGFVAGNKGHTRQFSMNLASHGYSVFNISYPLAPGTHVAGQLKAVLDALGWVSANCGRYKGDPSRIVIAGNSAGAYLAALAATVCTNPGYAGTLGIRPTVSGESLKGVLLFSGLYDLATGATRPFPAIRSDIEMLLGVKGMADVGDLGKWSVIGNMSGGFPPAFVSSGAVDGLYPESLALVGALGNHGIPHTALLFGKEEKQARHDYQTKPNLVVTKRCMEAVWGFLSVHTAPAITGDR